MKDGRLRILDINTGQTTQTPSMNSQVNVSAGAHLHSALLEPCENGSSESRGPKHTSL